jgi:hypothetical protein
VEDIAACCPRLRCTQITCFTGTKVQILTPEACRPRLRCTQITGFTSTKVQILTPEACCPRLRHVSMAWCSKVSDASLIALARCPLYLLYWYKSTNTDRFGGVVLPKCLTPPLLRSPDARFTCFTSTSKKKAPVQHICCTGYKY